MYILNEYTFVQIPHNDFFELIGLVIYAAIKGPQSKNFIELLNKLERTQ